MSTSYVNSQFKITLKIEGYDKLSSTIDRIEILNSMNTGWPIIYIYATFDNQMVIENNIFGQKELELEIIPLREDGIEREPKTTLRLLYLQSNLDLPEKESLNVGGNHSDEQRRKVIFQCFSMNAYNVWTTFVNKIFEEPSLLTPYEIVDLIMRERGFSSFMTMVSRDNINEGFINQLIIPPMSLKKMVEYVDEKLSIYKGPLFRYCNYSGHIVMFDLWKNYEKNKENPVLHVFKLPSHYDDPNRFDVVNKKISAKPDIMTSTFRNFETVHNSNSSLIHSGSTNVFITKPRENLFHLTQVESELVKTEMGFFHQSTDWKIHPFMKNRKKYYNDFVGFENEGYSGKMVEDFASARMSNNIMNCFTIRFEFNRNINIDNVMKVGEVVYIDAESEHEMLPDTNYSGAYVMNSSNVVFYRKEGTASWDCSCRVVASRTIQQK